MADSVNETKQEYVDALKKMGIPMVYFDGKTVTCPECGRTLDVAPVDYSPLGEFQPVVVGMGINCPICGTYFKAVFDSGVAQ